MTQAQSDRRMLAKRVRRALEGVRGEIRKKLLAGSEIRALLRFRTGGGAMDVRVDGGVVLASDAYRDVARRALAAIPGDVNLRRVQVTATVEEC